jgi:hypothetical protein
MTLIGFIADSRSSLSPIWHIVSALLFRSVLYLTPNDNMHGCQILDMELTPKHCGGRCQMS